MVDYAMSAKFSLSQISLRSLRNAFAFIAAKKTQSAQWLITQ